MLNAAGCMPGLYIHQGAPGPLRPMFGESADNITAVCVAFDVIAPAEAT